MPHIKRRRKNNSPAPELPENKPRCIVQAKTTGFVTANICPGCMLENSTLRTPNFTALTFDSLVYHPETNQLQVSGSGVDLSTPAEYILSLTPSINAVELTLNFPNRRENYRADQLIIVRSCS
jgi:hypothetical protein